MKPSTVFTVLLLSLSLHSTVSQDNQDDSTTETTTSDVFDCKWLDVNFTYTSLSSWPSTKIIYNGTCCSETAIETLKESNQYSWIANLDSPEVRNRWSALTKLLFCTPGACTEPNPVWTNCSGVFMGLFISCRK
uniref:Uncharacterized protein n=1 Tax=Caenorhabditis japonica TaxID=281687 RepID=A0A8R1EAL0_CAEJA